MIRIKHIILTASCLIGCWSMGAAQLPNSEIFAFSIIKSGDAFKISKASYLSDFNPDGYTNQPEFISADEVLFTSNVKDKEIPDLYKSNIRLGKLQRLTDTGLAEYSPQEIPGQDYYSCIRVEEDNTTQLLWAYPTDLSHGGFSPLPDVPNVGYHRWLSTDQVALFLVGTPHELAIANIDTKEVTSVIENIGRCLKTDKEGNLLFVHKITDNKWYLKSYSAEDNVANTLIETLEGVEDFGIYRDQEIIVGKGSKLYSADLNNPTVWSELIDLAPYGVQQISRLAVRNNKLIVVSNE